MWNCCSVGTQFMLGVDEKSFGYMLGIHSGDGCTTWPDVFNAVDYTLTNS